MAAPTVPDALDALRRFVNTLDPDDHVDGIETPEAAGAWLVENDLLAAGVRLRRGDVARLIRVREALRDLAEANHGAGDAPDALAALDEEAARAPVVVSVGGGGLGPARPGVDGVIGRLLATVHDAQIDGTWARVKTCPADDCRWVFFDTTKNRSRTWCSMESCGNRAKARSFRTRHSRPAKH